MSEEEGEEEVGEDVSRKSERGNQRGIPGGREVGEEAEVGGRQGEDCSRLSLWAAIQLLNKDTETYY